MAKEISGDPYGTGADTHFQSTEELPDWRDSPPDHDEQDDDVLLAETPPDVIAMLGWDPRDLEDEDEDQEDDTEPE